MWGLVMGVVSYIILQVEISTQYKVILNANKNMGVGNRCACCILAIVITNY